MEHTGNDTRENRGPLKLAGFSLKAVSSNLRSLPLPKSAGVSNGVGNEGSIILVRVASKGAYASIEDRSGRDIKLAAGDHFVGVLGHRCSSYSVVGGIPEGGLKLHKGDRLALLSKAGLIGKAECVSKFLGGKATEVVVEGLITADGKPISISNRLKTPAGGQIAPLLLVIGTAAEVGKTTFAEKITYWLSKRGYRVAAAKIAGTGRMRDIKRVAGSGAIAHADFVDAGLASTYGRSDYAAMSKGIFRYLSGFSPDIIIAEGGGDLIWGGLPEVLRDSEVQSRTAAIAVVPKDAAGAIGAKQLLANWGLSAPSYIISPIGANPLGFKKRIMAFLKERPFNMRDRGEFEEIAEIIRGKLG